MNYGGKEMQRKGCKHLRIASILVILLGVISILAVQLLLGASEAETAAGLSESALKSALAGIVAIYAMNIFKIIAGLIGLVMSNKKSLLTVILGGLLFIIQLAEFFQTGSSIVEIVINIILLVIPYYYFHNAVRNYKDQ